MRFLSFSRLSIRQRLPFLITALLLTILLFLGIVSYLGIRNAEIESGEQRLQTSSLQLSNMLSNSTRNMVATAHGQANDPSVIAWLASGGKDSAAQMESLVERLQKDTAYLGFAVLDSGLRTLFHFARDGRSVIPFGALDRPRCSKKELGFVGKLFLLGDTVCYPVTAVAWHNDKALGYLVKWRHMKTTQGSVEQVKGLIGLGAHFYVGNADGSLWTDMLHGVPSRPYRQADSSIFHFTTKGEPALASIRTIGNSNWLVSVEFVQAQLLQTANRYLYLLLVTGAVLLAFGIACGWIMSRNISRPLAELTSAASRIAEGEENVSPVPVHRFDEIGTLARSFNAMAAQVHASRAELQKEAAHYKLLFQKNPMPMWILSLPDLSILDVNTSAIHHYGYTREEFLQLNSRDMRPPEDEELFLKGVRLALKSPEHRGTWRHKKKDGTIITVDVIANDTVYNGQPARLVLANDITEKLKAEAALIHHRVLQQQVITKTTILVQEKEREEIGRELHDNINQILTSAKLYLELAKSGDRELVTGAIESSYANINLAIGEVRKLSKQLVKPAFDTSLKEALKDMTDEWQALAEVDIDFCAMTFSEEQVDEGLKLTLYRIVQEQLNNIVKYATASRVFVQLKTDPENVYLLIKDNGVGFDTNKKSKGIGLRNIDHRVRFHKGRATIHSQPGAGCTIEICVPLKDQRLAATDLA